MVFTPLNGLDSVRGVLEGFEAQGAVGGPVVGAQGFDGGVDPVA